MCAASASAPVEPPLDPRSFLRQSPPFDALSPGAFQLAADSLEIAFFPHGTRVLAADGRPSEALYLVRKGLVRLEKGGETALVLEEGDFFGYSVLTGTVAFDVVVEEDLLAYRIPEGVFRQLLATPAFARFFTVGLTERLRSSPASGAETGLAGDVLVPIGTLVDRAVVSVPADATVEETARVMRDERVGSVLIESDPLSIVTDRDLRNKVLAAGRPASTPAREVASSPVRTVPSSTPFYGAWQVMLQHGVHHLPVERDGRIVGVVTSTDLLRHHSHGPLLAFKRVERMRDRTGLEGYGRDLTRMVSTLVRGGLPATHVARFVSHLNDALVLRILGFAERELGPAPCPYAFLVFGSEGRFEQTLLTDQDNALVYQEDSKEAAAYFPALAEKVVGDLLRAGFPSCPGGYMATNWKGPLREWEERFASWIQTPQAEAVLAAAIFFDYRSVGGGLDLAPLAAVVSGARHNAPFLSHLARAAVGFRPPIGAFRRLDLEDGGVDLKKGGIAPIQGLARLWALDADIRVPSTVDRLKAASRAGMVDPETCDALVEAYVFLLGLRLREQLKAAAEGTPLGNRVSVDSLSPAERRHLKEAFLAVRSAQRDAVHRYQVTLA